MSDLVVIAFPSECKGGRSTPEILAIQKEYLIELGDAAIAVKDEQGNVAHQHHGCRRRFKHFWGSADRLAGAAARTRITAWKNMSRSNT